MDPVDSACRVLVGIKLHSRKDILLDDTVGVKKDIPGLCVVCPVLFFSVTEKLVSFI